MMYSRDGAIHPCRQLIDLSKAILAEPAEELCDAVPIACFMLLGNKRISFAYSVCERVPEARKYGWRMSQPQIFGFRANVLSIRLNGCGLPLRVIRSKLEDGGRIIIQRAEEPSRYSEHVLGTSCPRPWYRGISIDENVEVPI